MLEPSDHPVFSFGSNSAKRKTEEETFPQKTRKIIFLVGFKVFRERKERAFVASPSVLPDLAIFESSW